MKTLRWLICGVAAVLIIHGAARADLPLRQVTLFNSGVGHFERSGQVDGPQQVEFHFRQDQINDVIKTLVWMDQDGGSVSAVTYDARDPLERTLRSFPVDLSDNPALAEVLNRVRGLTVRVKASARDVEGVVMGVEERVKQDGDIRVAEPVLNLWTGNAIRAISLFEIQELTILDESTAEGIDGALATLGSRMDQGRKGLRLQFQGQGTRFVRVAYMLETPIWKTSYRLVVRDDDATLQGWAHIENVTDEDWAEVVVSLVSGRPISFIQNLYDPIYVQRPTVTHRLHEETTPPLYDRREVPAAPMAMAVRSRLAGAAKEQEMADAAMSFGGVDLEGQSALADGEDTGELFQYTLKVPVSIPRQSSAMLPIVQAGVKGEGWSIYNEAVNRRHPINAWEFENTSGAFLMQGPVAVFEGGIYAGDAQMPDTRDGETRLLGYAVDLATEVIKDQPRTADRVVQVSAANGLIRSRQAWVRTTTYRVNSQRDHERSLIIEHPYQPDWKRLRPEGEVQRTATHYRFRLTVPPRETTVFEVQEERVTEQHWQIASLDDNRVEFLLRQSVLSAELEKALKELAKRRADMTDIQQRRDALLRSIQEITKEQERIRQNMAVVQRPSDSFSMWERKLIEQERELERLNEQVTEARAEEARKSRELSAWIAQWHFDK